MVKINPVLRNESKISSRTFRISLMIFFYILFLTIPILFMYYISTSESYYMGMNPSIFVNLYLLIACVQAVLLMFIVPALSAPAITSEREKQTLDILLSTKMTPLSIVTGKLLASASKVILLILCTIPIYSLGFLFGGVNFFQIIMLNLYFIITTLYVSAIGVCISSFVKTSKVANVLTYGLVLFVVIGTIGIFLIYTFIYVSKNHGMNSMLNLKIPFWLYINPALGFVGLLKSQIGAIGPLTILNEYSTTINPFLAMGVQSVLTILLILLASFKLNPLNNKFSIKKFKVKKVK
ncbi:ABC transporter permease [Clostridium tarantellae]|uniref:ABC transporter permease subunit n=1 Tax=Clostridium tarantellae TaxID=39493 RepID=A0A6I1MII4_9CLOT|nr:ABC transporter permease [Clostridium tarantellae]MPQ42714.1 ABC transporter permease subunit [Clostridium tarantellae]